MDSEFFFTKRDYDALCKKISKIDQTVKGYTVLIGSVVDSSGDQWHDANLYHAQRMSESWSNELRKLVEIKNKAVIMKGAPPKDGMVRFGKTVKIEDLDSGEILSYKISSYI